MLSHEKLINANLQLAMELNKICDKEYARHYKNINEWRRYAMLYGTMMVIKNTLLLARTEDQLAALAIVNAWYESGLLCQEILEWLFREDKEDDFYRFIIDEEADMLLKVISVANDETIKSID